MNISMAEAKRRDREMERILEEYRQDVFKKPTMKDRIKRAFKQLITKSKQSLQ